MKKLYIALTIILSLILIKLVVTYSINQKVITEYEKGIYRKDLISFLKKTNWNEPSIVHYNEGNIYFQEKNYKKAIKCYKKALNKKPNKKQICDIRINITLALLEESKNTTDTDELLKELKKARENLYNDHCAEEYSDQGDSLEAEELEQDIKDQEQELEENKKNNKDNKDEKEQEQKEQKQKEQQEQKPEEYEETEEEKKTREEIQSINKGAKQSREGELSDYKGLNDYQYYSGKNW